jgi:hypothetical protein
MLILLKQLDKGVDQLMDEEFFTSCLHKKWTKKSVEQLEHLFWVAEIYILVWR